MLKLTYTDDHFYLERLSESLENWLTIRTLLHLRAAKRISIEHSAASFSIMAGLPNWDNLRALEAENQEKIEFNLCDAEYMEVSLQGIWVTSEEPTNEEPINEGVFVCNLSKKAEIMLDQLG